MSAKKYVPGYEHNNEKSKKQYNALLKAMGLKNLSKSAPSAQISLNVGYWRKANQIHNWFVKEAQNGVDDCGSYPVEREQLEKLVALCKQGLADKASAAKSLPTSSGFFFGSTNYDEYYYRDLTDTVEQIESILNNKSLEGWYFEYQASW